MSENICIDGIEIKTLVVDKNCWIVNLKPYGPEDDPGVIKDFQQKCIDNKMFGIGWINNKRAPQDRKEYPLKDVSWFQVERKDEKKFKTAKENMDGVKAGDIVITRLMNGHIYIGKVEKEAFYRSGIKDKNDDERLSCMCEVEEWYEIKNQDDVPAALSGRFLHRWQKTIERIGKDEEKILMMTVYEQKINRENNLPKIRLTKDNFDTALNPKELEDLVCAYMYDKNTEGDYLLLPSLCSVARQKYEFTLVSRNGKKPITCQVKNQNAIPIKISDYTNDMDAYEKIYLFSGNSNIIGEETGNIKIIKPNELYGELVAQKCGSMKYLRDKLERYYCINNDDACGLIIKIKEKLEANGKLSTRYTKSDRYKVWSDNDNTNDENTNILGVGVNGGYFSNSFGCFIVWDRDKFEKSMEAFGIEWKV